MKLCFVFAKMPSERHLERWPIVDATSMKRREKITSRDKFLSVSEGCVAMRMRRKGEIQLAVSIESSLFLFFYNESFLQSILE